MSQLVSTPEDSQERATVIQRETRINWLESSDSFKWFIDKVNEKIEKLKEDILSRNVPAIEVSELRIKYHTLKEILNIVREEKNIVKDLLSELDKKK